MSGDLTDTIPQSTDEQLKLILTTVLSTSVRVDGIDLRLGRVEQAVGQLQEGQQRLEGKVDRLEGKVDRLEGKVDRLEGKVDRLEEGQEALRSDLEMLKRTVNHKFLILSGQVQASYNKLEERVTCLELKANPPNPQT